MRSLRTPTIVLCLSLASLAFPDVGMAQATKQPSAETLQLISQFKSDPTTWLNASKKAGNIAASVQQMVDADPTLSQTFINFAKQQNDALSKANIAVGLAQAAGDLVQSGDQNDAQAIQQQIALAGDTGLLNSFVAGSNTVQTTATGTTATGAGTIGGGTGGITNNGTGSTSNSTGTTSSSGTATANTSSTPTANTTPTFTLASSTPTSTSSTATSVSPAK